MTLIVLLFLAGIILIAAEVILPGGIIGTIGGLLMAAASVLAFFEFGNSGGFIALGIACAIGGLALFLEFRVLPKTKIGKRAFLTEQVNGVAAAFGTEARELIGEAAEAVTPLSPSGYVLIKGRRYEAFCQSGQAPTGSALEVIGADNFRLIVTQR
jgi:membrane-bound ClpP family serine protease